MAVVRFTAATAHQTMTLFDDFLFENVAQHLNHELDVTAYGDDDVLWNIAVECRDCHTVLLDIEPEENDQFVNEPQTQK